MLEIFCIALKNKSIYEINPSWIEKTSIVENALLKLIQLIVEFPRHLIRTR